MPLRVHKKKLTNSTPFCKICFDAGKPESQYTSHFVKDSPGPNGKVVCPYLLTLNCRYCKENGHTISHCPLLQKKKAYSTVCSPSIPKQEARETQKIVTVAPKKPTRGFAVLANLPPGDDPNADPVDTNPTPSGVRSKINIKPLGAWANGAPQDKPTITIPALPKLEDINDDWLSDCDSDDWNDLVEMGKISEGNRYVRRADGGYKLVWASSDR